MSFDMREYTAGVVEKSKRHLDEVDETYINHMKFALYAIWMMGSAIILLIIHLLIPAWFQCSASNRILKLAEDLKARRDRLGCQE